jgi:hypothetical protein
MLKLSEFILFFWFGQHDGNGLLICVWIQKYVAAYRNWISHGKPKVLGFERNSEFFFYIIWNDMLYSTAMNCLCLPLDFFETGNNNSFPEVLCLYAFTMDCVSVGNLKSVKCVLKFFYTMLIWHERKVIFTSIIVNALCARFRFNHFIVLCSSAFIQRTECNRTTSDIWP